MVITPNSDVILLKCPLELNQENQLNFANTTAQYNYFYGLPKLVLDSFTYQRKDGMLRVPRKYDDVYTYNYVMYRNTNYSNKWFYAFLEKPEYINDGMTAFQLKTDVFQTYQFDLTYKQTFVEREHVNDDTAGKHTVPEGLELGEYEIVDLRRSPIFEDADSAGNWWICFCVTALPSTTTNLEAGGRVRDTHYSIGNVFSTLKFFAVNTEGAAADIVKKYEDKEGGTTSEAIVNVYMIPRCCVDVNTTNHTIASTGHNPSSLGGHGLYPILNSYTSDELQLQQPSVLAENYSPVNKKLLSYPFSYFYISNNLGTDVEYKYEDFPIETLLGNTARTMRYKKCIVPSSGVSAKLYFTKYKSYVDGGSLGQQMYNYGITFGKTPVCAWTTDYYTNWLTQNGVNVTTSIASGLASGALGVGASLATGNALGAVYGTISALTQISSTLGEVEKAKTTPPQAHGDINTGDAMYAYLRNSVTFYEMSVRKEVAQRIDAYFSMFGYKVNAVKTPNIIGRTNWNYVKTINCYIQADIPQEDLQEIENMFNNGVTIWHNPATFMDYSQSNSIVV